MGGKASISRVTTVLAEATHTLRAKVFRGLADPARLAILAALANGRRSVREVVEETELSQPNVSAHLACLFECGLLKREREGRFVYYELSGPEVRALIAATDRVLRRSAAAIAACVNYDERGRRPGG